MGPGGRPATADKWITDPKHARLSVSAIPTFWLSDDASHVSAGQGRAGTPHGPNGGAPTTSMGPIYIPGAGGRALHAGAGRETRPIERSVGQPPAVSAIRPGRPCTTHSHKLKENAMSEHTEATHDEQNADDDVLFWARFTHIINTALAGLSEQDMAERLAHCRATGQHGISAQEADASGGAVRLVWGGRTLAVVSRSVFTDEGYTLGLDMNILPTAPDDARDLT